MQELTNTIPVVLADGSRVLVEAVVLGGDEDVAGFDQLLSFAKVTDAIEAMAKTLTATFDKVKPDRASVEFSVQAALEAGELTALIARGSAAGSVKITLEWGR
jgi:hypothetical protein